MQQQMLYSLAIKLGFTIDEFFDTPEYFGSWFIDVKKNNKTYRIEYDGREGWFVLYNEGDEDLIRDALTEDQMLEQYERWLEKL